MLPRVARVTDLCSRQSLSMNNRQFAISNIKHWTYPDSTHWTENMQLGENEKILVNDIFRCYRRSYLYVAIARVRDIFVWQKRCSPNSRWSADYNLYCYIDAMRESSGVARIFVRMRSNLDDRRRKCGNANCARDASRFRSCHRLRWSRRSIVLSRSELLSVFLFSSIDRIDSLAKNVTRFLERVIENA